MNKTIKPDCKLCTGTGLIGGIDRVNRQGMPMPCPCQFDRQNQELKKEGESISALVSGLSTLDPSDTITLHRDPFTLECFHRLRRLVDATRELLSNDLQDDLLQTIYARGYLQFRTKKTFASDEIRKIVQRRLDLAHSIRDEGYFDDRWKERGTNAECGRRNEESGYGPITIQIHADGHFTFRDGTHRACILHCLGQPIRASVYSRHLSWTKLKRCDDPLYSFHPHPDLNSSLAIRTNQERFPAIADALHKVGLTGKVFHIGCCSGLGPATLSGRGFQVQAIDHNPLRSELANAWARAADLPFTCRHIALDDCEIPRDINTVVGSSVWHHLAADKETLAQRIKMVAHCPATVIELPADNQGPWHDSYADECDDKVKTLYKLFDEIGGFRNRKLIYKDSQYHNRETYLLTK